MRLFKNYFYNKKLKAERLVEAQKNIGMIHSVLVAAMAADKEKADRAEERHKELMVLSEDNKADLVMGLAGLKESLDNFLQSQAGMNNIIKKFFKMEIDNAMVESVIEKEEPTEHDKRF